MALVKNLASRWGSLARMEILAWSRAASSAPSVYDKIVDITVIDRDGRRHLLRGLAGESLANLLAAHVDTLGDDAIARSPAGRGEVDAHVKVPNEMLQMVPPPEGDDQRYLQELAIGSSIDKHSRLASRIILNKDLQGALIALGDLYPWKSI